MDSVLLKLLLMALQHVLVSCSWRSVRMVYRPYGPLMCKELGQDSSLSFNYIKESLSCRRIPGGDTIVTRQQDFMANGSFTEPDTGRAKLKDLPYSHNETLLRACEEGKLSTVQYLLGNNLAHIDCRGKQGRTPIMVAAENAMVAIFDFLFTKNCNQSISDDLKFNTLHLAVVGGSTDIVRKLLKSGKYDIESRCELGMTPLAMAAGFGNKDVFHLLVSSGSNLNVFDSDHNTLLHAACHGGNLDIVKFLYSQNIFDIEQKGEIRRTPVLTAATEGHTDIVDFLWIKGCNMKAVDEQNNTILHIAALNGRLGLVKYIISKGILDIDSKGFNGRTAATLAAEHGFLEIFDVLVFNNCNLSSVDIFQNTALHLASLHGHLDIVKYILSRYPSFIDLRELKGNTPVMFAVTRGYRKLFDLLMTKGCNLTLRDIYGNTILHLACFKGHVEMVKHILSMNLFDIDIRGPHGLTPAMIAGLNGFISLFDLLARKGCNLILADHHQNTILHLACLRGHLDIVKYLVKLGHGNTAMNEFGQTPFMTAASKGYKKIALFLRKVKY